MSVAEIVQLRGYATELRATLEEIRDKRSQYGREPVDARFMLKRCFDVARELEMLLGGDSTPPGAA